MAILGVFRAGSAFPLLDPRLPTSRLLSHCSDVGATMVLTSPECAAITGLLGSDLVLLSIAPVDSCEDGEKATTIPPMRF
jgi:non-ribosomal peptide synthetase component F